MLAIPGDVISALFRARRNGCFILPHVFCHIVPPSQVIGNVVSVYIEDKTNNSVERVCREELDFGIGRHGPHELTSSMAQLITPRKVNSLTSRE